MIYKDEKAILAGCMRGAPCLKDAYKYMYAFIDTHLISQMLTVALARDVRLADRHQLAPIPQPALRALIPVHAARGRGGAAVRHDGRDICNPRPKKGSGFKCDL